MVATTVIVAISGADESAVTAALEAHPRLTVARRCADLAEAVAAAEAGVGSAALIASSAHLTRSAVAALASSLPVLVGLAADALEAQSMRELGFPTVLARGEDPHAIAAALAAAAQDPAQRERSNPPPLPPELRDPELGAVVAVWGPAGAPGRTTVALNVAAELAAAGTRTVLIDVDTYGGAVGQAVGLTDEAAGLAGAVREAQHGAVDRFTVARHAIAVGERLAVLTGITRPERWPELPGPAVAAVIDAARTAAQVVVLDCGFSLEADEGLQYDTRAPQRNGASLAALDAATRVVAVGGAEPLSMQRLIHGLSALRDRVPGEPVVVVNRVRPSVAGTRPEETVADVLARFAGVPRVFPIPYDSAALDAAALEGRVLAECAPRSRARRAIASLAQAVVAPTAHAAPPRAAALVSEPVGD